MKKKLDGTRGLSKKEKQALQALQIFLEDYGITDVDVEPLDRGVRITANDSKSKPIYASWGLDIEDAVNKMVRSVIQK